MFGAFFTGEDVGFFFGRCSNTLFIRHEPSQCQPCGMISIENYFSTQIPVPFSPVYCTVFAHPIVKGESTRTIDPLLIHSFIHPEQSEPQFLNVRHKSPPPKLNLVYGACVPESYTLLPPPRLAAYQRTGNSSRGRHACHGCFLLTRFRRQPAGSPTHIQTLTRPARRNSRTSAGAWLMYAHAKTN